MESRVTHVHTGFNARWFTTAPAAMERLLTLEGPHPTRDA